MGKRVHPITGCRADLLFGVWFMDALHLEQVVQAAFSFDLHQLMKTNEERDKQEEEKPPTLYLVDNGVAKMEISGVITKHPTSFRYAMDCSATKTMIEALETACKDPLVHTISMHFEDCPGGCAWGIPEAAAAIRAADEIKPVIAHVSDLCASAGMFLASQARHLTASSNAEVGSIGTMALLYDKSEAYKREGIKVIPVVTGKFKAVGAPGTELTKEQLEYLQHRVNKANEVFVRAIAEGRNLSMKDAQQLADEARVYHVSEAIELKLVDGISTYPQHLAEVVKFDRSRVAVRGPSQKDRYISQAASQRSEGMLTTQQLEQAKKLPGAAAITAENADGVLLQAAVDLSQKVSDLTRDLTEAKKLIPEQESEKLLIGFGDLAHQRIEVLKKEGKVTEAQAVQLKEMVMKDKKPNIAMLSADANGKRPYEAILGLLENNQPNGLAPERTGGQPSPRTTPGSGQQGNEAQLMNSIIDQHNKTVGRAPKEAATAK